jgi:hypothetical protein
VDYGSGVYYGGYGYYYHKFYGDDPDGTAGGAGSRTSQLRRLWTAASKRLPGRPR